MLSEGSGCGVFRCDADADNLLGLADPRSYQLLVFILFSRRNTYKRVILPEQLGLSQSITCLSVEFPTQGALALRTEPRLPFTLRRVICSTPQSPNAIRTITRRGPVIGHRIDFIALRRFNDCNLAIPSEGRNRPGPDCVIGRP